MGKVSLIIWLVITAVAYFKGHRDGKRSQKLLAERVK